MYKYRSDLYCFAMILCCVTSVVCWQVAPQVVFGQSGMTWKHCGNPDGSTNALCPQCVGTCKMNFAAGGGRQSYKICAGSGTGCTMPAKTNAFCSGLLFDGGANGTGCDGNQIGTCQYNIKKCT